jgi:hypothetical protein
LTVLLAIAALVMAQDAPAQAYPVRQIRLIVKFSSGAAAASEPGANCGVHYFRIVSSS